MIQNDHHDLHLGSCFSVHHNKLVAGAEVGDSKFSRKREIEGCIMGIFGITLCVMS